MVAAAAAGERGKEESGEIMAAKNKGGSEAENISGSSEAAKKSIERKK